MKYLIIMNCRFIVVLFFLGVGMTQPLKSQTLQLLDTTLTEIVVSARLINSTQEIPPLNVLKKNEIFKSQGRTLPESIGSLGGVFIQKTNHGGGSPFVRGLTGNHILTVVDGIRFNNATYRYGPNQYLNTIDIFTIDKVEVKHGEGGVEYGSDAVGGTILLSTTEPQFSDKKKIYLNILGRAITQDMEYSFRTDAQYSSPKFGLIAGLTSRTFGDLYGGKNTKKQKPSGYEEMDYNLGLKIKLSDSLQFQLQSQSINQTNIPLFHKVKLENFQYYNFDPQSSQLSYAKLVKKSKSKFITRLEFITAYIDKKEIRRYKKNNSSFYFLETDKVNTKAFILKMTSKFNNNWSAESGIDSYHDYVRSSAIRTNEANGNEENRRGLYADKSVFNSNSIFTTHHYTFKEYLINMGMRINGFNIKVPLEELISIGSNVVKLRPNAIVYNVNVGKNFGEHHQVSFSINKGFRAPNIDDMSSLGVIDFRYEIPNYNLKSEHSHQYEIGYKYNADKLHIQTSLFHIDLKNMISRVKKNGDTLNGYLLYHKENSQKAYIRGCELSIKYDISSTFSIMGNACYLFGKNTSLNEPLRRMPPFNGRLNLSYERKNLDAIFEYIFSGSQGRLAQGDKDDNRIPLGGTKAWNIFNFHTSYNYKNVKLQMSFNNILDEDYRYHGSGINGIGRHVSTTIHINI